MSKFSRTSLRTLPSEKLRYGGRPEPVNRVKGVADAFDPNFDSVALLLSFDGSDGSTSFVDTSAYGRLVSATGGAQISTAQSKWGGSSVFFNGTSSYLTAIVPGGLGSSDFTLEFWIYALNTAGFYFNNRTNGDSGDGFDIVGNGGVTTSNAFLIPGFTLPLNTWVHYALVRNGGTLRRYINGILQGFVDTAINFSGSTFRIGGSPQGNTGYFSGYIDDFRLSRIARYTSAFTPPISAFVPRAAPETTNADPFFSNVSLLLPFNGASGSTAFVDASTNNVSVAVTGNSQISTTRSKFGGASGYFDGSGDYLTFPASSLFSFPGDFTIEFWAYWEVNRANIDTLLEIGQYTDGVMVRPIDGSVYINNVLLSGSLGFTLGTWIHIAIVRSGSQCVAYKNGQVACTGSVTGTVNAAANASRLCESTHAGGRCFQGNIDDFRITKGVARYAGAFTPPDAPLPVRGPTPVPTIIDPQFNNVSLLLPMNGSNGSTTFTDASSNVLSVTASGNAQISTAQSRWGTGALRTTRSNGSLVLPSTALLELTGDFTLEFWIYAVQDRGKLINLGPSGTIELNQNTSAEVGNNAYKVYIRNASIELFDNVAFGLTNQTWHHFALTRSGTSLRLFGGGTLYATATHSGTFTISGISGQSGSFDNFDGYIDDLRITKGFARYTASFAPPSTAFPTSGSTTDPSFGNVSLLLPMDGANGSTTFTDASSNALTVTRSGNTQISAAQSRWGGTSALFDGVEDYLAITPTTLLQFDGDFTIECWIYPTSTADMIIGSSASDNNSQCFRINQNGAGNLSFFLNGVQVFGDTAAGITANNWHHIALSRSGTSTRMFVGGVQIGSTNTSWSGTFRIDVIGTFFFSGSRFTSTVYDFNGYIDDFRITKGIARYTSNFTPPSDLSPTSNNTQSTGVDPYYQNVAVLLPFNGANNSTAFPDASLNNRATIASGDAKNSALEKKWGNASARFDGTNDYLTTTVPGGLGSTTWTLEFWIYPITNSWSYFGNRTGGNGGDGFDIRNAGNGQITTDQAVLLGGFTPSLNQWTHYALVANSGTVTRYINGVAQGSFSTGNFFDGSTFRIGGIPDTNGGNQGFFNGYMDDFRLTRNIARYITDFTPPLRPHPTKGPSFSVNALSPVFWYDFSDISTVTTTGGRIDSIGGKGGRGWALTRSTTGPLYVTGINGLNCSDWGTVGHSNFLRSTTNTATSMADIFIVMDAAFGPTFPDFNGFVGHVDGSAPPLAGGSGSTGLYSVDSFVDQVFINGGTTNKFNSILPDINSPCIVRFNKANGAASITTSGFQIGADRNYGRGFRGLIGEVIVFPTVLGQVNASNLITHLRDKWGI